MRPLLLEEFLGELSHAKYAIGSGCFAWMHHGVRCAVVCDVRGSASQVCECLCECCARSRTSELACLCLTCRKQLQFVDETTGAVVNITGHKLTVVGFKTHHGFEVCSIPLPLALRRCVRSAAFAADAGDHIRRQRQARHVP